MDNSLDRISYALGLSMGNNFQASGIKTINVKDFADGVAAVFEGAAPKMTYDEAKKEIKEFFEKMEAEQRAAAEKMGEVNAAAGKTFLDENGKRVEVKTTASGLQYEVLEEGTGKMPAATDSVTVHYTGKLIDGTVFEALQMMKEGAKWRLFIPSNLAYGPNGAGNVIGPNATLIFDVELIKVNN